MTFTREQQHAAREAVRPVLWARLSVHHTKKTCALSILVPLLALAVIIGTRVFNVDNPTDEAYFVRDDIRTRLDDARNAARAQFAFGSDVAPEDVPKRSVPDTDLDLAVIFRGRVGVGGEAGVLNETDADAINLLTREGVAFLKSVEDAMVADAEYGRFCLHDVLARDCEGNPMPCVLPDSVTNNRFLYGIYRDGELCGRRMGSEPVSEADFASFMNSLFEDDPSGDGLRVVPEVSSRLGTDLSPDSRRTWIARTVFHVGQPFDGFASELDDPEQQKKDYDEWSDAVVNRLNDLTTPTIDVFVFGFRFANAQFGSIALRDLSFSVAAIVAVFLIICFHTGSVLLAVSTMVQIFLAFPLAFIVYHFILRQLYFSSLQILAIFLLLGIGADDVFVFTDAWKQAAVVLGVDVDLLTRMSWTYRRSVRAMSVTSLTTSAAFFVTATSPLIPISSLGLWAALLVILQFVLVITIYPCAIIMQHRFWRVRSWRNCLRAPEDTGDDNAASPTTPKTPLWHRCLPARWRPTPAEPGSEQYRMLEKFFRGPWINSVRRIRYGVVVIAVLLVALSIFLATRLETPADTEAFLPPEFPLSVALMNLREAFPRSDADFQLRVRITWGISGIDRDGTSKFDLDNLGRVVLDNSFDLKPAASQQAILDACDFFGSNRSLIFQEPTLVPVDCWIEDFKNWRAEVGKGDEFETYTTDRALVEDLIEFGDFERDGRLPYLRYLNTLQIAFDNDLSRVVTTEIRFVSPALFAQPVRVMLPIHDAWQGQLSIFNARAPEGANNAIATGGTPWKWMITQRTLVRSMFTGIGVMLAVALLTLAFSTFNWLIAILATISIAGIVAMLLGLIYVFGWDLGIAESLGVVISIGFSFDGVAHIATAYVESDSDTKFNRAKDALTDLGISILFGAVTTMVAGLMLFPAIITFFVKFGGFVVSTISLSILWSLLIFPALLLLVGPVREFGSVMPLLRKVFFCFRAKNTERPSKDDSDYKSEESHSQSDGPSSGSTGISSDIADVSSGNIGNIGDLEANITR